MKKYFASLAVAAAFVATPAMANDFAGVRTEVTAGLDDVTNAVDATDVTYGAAIGYDLQFGKVVLGVEATAANVFDRADLGGAARLGYTLNKNVLAFGRVGYNDLERPQTCTPGIGNRPAVCRDASNLDGVTVGGGIEAILAGPFFTKVEYRYTDFAGTAARHGAVVGVGVRF
jgi:outer membrane immunogenic protein